MKKLSLTAKIFISMVLGIIAGLLLQGNPDIAVTYIKPVGTVYLNLIKMVVVPVVLLSIMQGIVSLEDIRIYMNESIQVRRVMIGRKKREIEHHIHYEKDQIRTIHALCGQDILALSKETLQKVKSQFEDDPDVIGRWNYCGYLPTDAEFTGEENLLQDNSAAPVLFFLPGGEEV